MHQVQTYRNQVTAILGYFYALQVLTYNELAICYLYQFTEQAVKACFTLTLVEILPGQILSG